MEATIMIESYFRSSGYSVNNIINDADGNSCDLLTLPAFLRTLLVMDGTVTKALEAWFWEPVKVIPQLNELMALTKKIEGLEAQKGDQVLHREVILQGDTSNKVFACARSTVSLELLPTKTSGALKSGKIGIGELFREQGLETYRDIININYYLEPPLNDELLTNLSGEIISRSYQIWVNGSAAIVVTEFFPVNIC